MAEENKGQELESPTSKESGQKPESPAGSMTDKILANLEASEAAKTEEPAASTEEKKPEAKVDVKAEGKEKPPPYDQDPKWKAARAAEKRLNTLLEKHGFDSPDELEEALGRGLTVAEVLGDRDAKQLIKDADYLKEVQAYWDDQKRLKEEEDLDPEEIAQKAKKELSEFKKQAAEKERQEKDQQELKNALQSYTSAAEKAIESVGISQEESEMAKLFLGVDNPFNEIDITDKKQVKETLGQNAKKFKTFLDGVRQKAVDDYAKGKSKITPISPASATGGSIIQKTELPPGITVEKAFSDATNRILEAIESSATS